MDRPALDNSSCVGEVHLIIRETAVIAQLAGYACDNLDVFTSNFH